MADITVTEIGPDTFQVEVAEGGSVSEHQVTIGPGALPGAAEGHPPSEVIEASFRFLLDREPKESILGRFDLGVISRYFPEYPEKISEYL